MTKPGFSASSRGVVHLAAVLPSRITPAAAIDAFSPVLDIGDPEAVHEAIRTLDAALAPFSLSVTDLLRIGIEAVDVPQKPAAFIDHRAAARALLRSGRLASSRAVQFCSSLRRQRAPLTHAQADWLASLLDRSGLPHLGVMA